MHDYIDLLKKRAADLDHLYQLIDEIYASVDSDLNWCSNAQATIQDKLDKALKVFGPHRYVELSKDLEALITNLSKLRRTVLQLFRHRDEWERLKNV